jgi:hypothetical protein
MSSTTAARVQTISRRDAERHIALLTGSANTAMNFRTLPESEAAKAKYAALSHGERKRYRLNYRGTLSQVFDKLKARSEGGFGVYYTLNVTDGAGAKKENIVAVRALPLDLDKAALPTSWDGGLLPHLVLESSPGKHQAIFLIEPTDDLAAASHMAQRLAMNYGGDPSVTDAARVLRLAGFMHQKGTPFRSRIVSTNNEFDPPPALDAFDPVLPKLPPRADSSLSGVGQLDAERAKLLFDALDPAEVVSDNMKWQTFAMALHASCGGDADVAEFFFDFCLRDARYANDTADDNNRYRWDSFTASKDGGLGIGTLKRICAEHGVDAAIMFDVFSDAADDFDPDDMPPDEEMTFEAARDDLDFNKPATLPAMKYDMVNLGPMLDYAEEAMSIGGAPLYQTAKRLVHPVRMERSSGDNDSVRRAAGALTIQDMTPLRLNQYMIDHAKFYLVKKAPNGAAAVKKKHAPPLRLAEHMIARPDQWKIPTLTGIIETPTLRRDGSLLADEGYDGESGLLLDMGGVTFPAIPDAPTCEDALKALKFLKRPLGDFPFVADGPKGKSASRSVMLSAMLTALVRRSLRSAPMHGFSAPTPGTGKTLAVQVAAVIATGHEVTAMSQGANAEEDEKRIFSVLMQGDQVVLVDNVTRPIGGNALCTILTEEFWQSRMLGFSRNASVATNVLMTASGNNLIFEGDMTRRALLCRMDAGIENPEGRSFDMNLKKWVPANRVKLVAAGLTVLRAFVAAGRPGLDKLSAFGSFEEWSDLVRGAIVWLGEADPCLTRSHIAADDPVKAELGEFLTAVHAARGAEWFTAGELLAIKETENAPHGDSLMEVIESTVSRVNKKRLGQYLKSHENQIIGGLRLQASFDEHRKINLYRISTI